MFPGRRSGAVAKFRFSTTQRWAVYSAHGGHCPWCGEPVPFKFIQIDHLVPESVDDASLAKHRAAFGLPQDFDVNSYENWIPTCGKCNNQKRASEYEGEVMLHRLGVARKKADKARAIEASILRNAKGNKMLVTLQVALDAGEVSLEDFTELLAATGPPRDLPEDTELSLGSLSASPGNGGWEVIGLFRKVVRILHGHLLDWGANAEVRTPGVLADSSGERQEVDVLITAELAGYPLRIAVESAPCLASEAWVDGMLQKHHRLPTDKLVLVSMDGFTPSALARARAADVTSVTAETLDVPGGVIGALGRVRAVVLNARIARMKMTRLDRHDTLVLEGTVETVSVFCRDGTEICRMTEALNRTLHAAMPKMMEEEWVRSAREDAEVAPKLTLERWTATKGDEDIEVCVRPAGEAEPVPVALEIELLVSVSVADIELSHAKIEEKHFAYGAGQFANDGEFVLVFGGGDEAPKVSFHIGDKVSTGPLLVDSLDAE